MIKINEIVQTIQGEGSWAGIPTTFIRFAKCNLSCVWCDTGFDDYVDMEIDEIMDHVRAAPATHVVITGGEPSLQLKELYHLVEALHQDSYIVGIETNGTCPLDIKAFDHITISPKDNVPMKNRNQEVNRHCVMNECHDLKIIDEGQTLQELNEWVSRIRAKKGYYLQPMSNDPKSIRRCARLVASQNCWQLSLQQHKIAGLR